MAGLCLTCYAHRIVGGLLLLLECGSVSETHLCRMARQTGATTS